MNRTQFEQHIKNTRDCDAALLDAAVSLGVERAKSEKPDAAKVIHFASSCAAVAAICFAMDLEPVKAAITAINPGGGLITENGAQILFGYFGSFMETIIYILGGI